MISVKEAAALISEHTNRLPAVKMALMEASGCVLAEDVRAVTDIPAFEQSSMDGYALLFAEKDERLHINGEMQAGSAQHLSLQRGQAVRIFTGAPLPSGADTVVMQEKTAVENGELLILDKGLQKGSNVRSRGSEIRAGDLAMKKGSLLSPAATGFLAGAGTAEVMVYPAPRVSVLVTGKELQKPGNDLQFGQVYESNSYSLRAALKQAHINAVEVFEADDDLYVLKSVLDTALQNSDVVLLTGGVSAGDYDYVLEACRLCGVQKVFHKVKQRPGKPLFFGTKDSKLVFGLPGNPSSVLTCFYEYALPAIENLSGKKSSIETVPAKLTGSYTKAPGLTHFLKGHYENGLAHPLNAQESFRLSSFAQANCLICLREDRTEYAGGEMVEVHLFP